MAFALSLLQQQQSQQQALVPPPTQQQQPSLTLPANNANLLALKAKVSEQLNEKGLLGRLRVLGDYILSQHHSTNIG